MYFEWDPDKARKNLKKHAVSFEEAATVFGDRLSITVEDPNRSSSEQRFVTLGVSAQGKILVVVHTDRGDTIRIISARIATRREKRTYEEED